MYSLKAGIREIEIENKSTKMNESTYPYSLYRNNSSSSNSTTASSSPINNNSQSLSPANRIINNTNMQRIIKQTNKNSRPQSMIIFPDTYVKTPILPTLQQQQQQQPSLPTPSITTTPISPPQIESKQSQYAQQLSSLEQTSTAEELKKRRNQLTLDYNYFLKRTGNDKLKESLGELAFDFTDEMFPDISRDVLSSLPSRVDTMPNDMDSMEALISELNNTNKNILIMDEIYINAMITMYLNDYIKKDTRDTTFIFRHFLLW